MISKALPDSVVRGGLYHTFSNVRTLISRDIHESISQFKKNTNKNLHTQKFKKKKLSLDNKKKHFFFQTV